MSHHILIVDDDKFLLDMYSIKFAERGFAVTIAGDGQEAIGKLDGGVKPDVFLVDLLMPKVDGFQLINLLKERQLDQAGTIIILSNLGQEEDIKKGLDMGVNGYIVKALATPTEVVNKTMDIVNNRTKKT